ncbi:sentrin-specific protease 7b isoform X1 [Hippoglossus hippoglossus]|uniref:sentrin-specific protease 7b isoform X1 n=1 Tax=Hippoglossus hippoglossus TaxID=8267 RepID=UPI00148DED31|nr:sentrin-specific protease 7b isoform X1 [Hippoglossus hippoglossus]
MASQYKIPRKKQSQSDSAHIHLQSPLSRLQSPAPQLKDYGDQSDRRRADRMHSGNTPGSSTNGHRTLCKPLFSDVVKTLLGLNSANKGGQSAANHRPLGSERASSSPSNRWRPKRTSDCRLASERLSPPQKKSFDSAASATKSISVVSVDSLAELRGEGHAGSQSPLTPGATTQRRVETAGNTTPSRDAAAAEGTFQNDRRKTLDSPSKLQNNSSEDDFVSPTRTVVHRTSVPSSDTETDGRRSLDRTAWTAMAAQREDVRERERLRWREFTDRKSNMLRLRTPAEPIVLSSEEEEEEGEDDRDRTKMASQSATSRPEEGSRLRTECSPRAEEGHDKLTLPSYLQLEFTSLHAGLMHADADGKMMITENGITVPVKVSEGEEGEVTVVASQLRGYGVWDGGVARGGTLLAGWEGPAPSLLFLWVTDAQANLLQRELSALRQSSASSGPSCCFLLLVLKEQLQELQAALLASILDMTEYQKGRSSSSSSCSSSCLGPSSPVDWTDGLLLLHSCPPPLDQHLLALLGHSATVGSASSSQRNRKSSLRSYGQQQLPVRLIQYPPPPCKGRISVTREDLARLNAGEFLNDVIIDFYLKFLFVEGVGGAVAERSHVFSSFFYKQLSRRRAAGEDDAPSVPDRHMRHQRVKTWTRHIDIFTKDFLFVPVNQEAHWFLVVVCFPGLEHEESQTCTGASEQATGKRGPSLRRQQPPDCTELGRHSHSVLKRPCVLVMDSLKLSYHENVCKLLRDYLQVEWEVRRRTPRLFTSDNMRSCSCRVPQQDNSSDCGLYLLQYVESFLQNPVVHFELPLRLDNWFPRQQVRQKREEIRSLIIKMHQSQTTKKTDQKPK